MIRILPIIMILLGSCAAKEREPANILIGWGPYEFGTSFDDAISLQPRIEWNLASLRECLNEISLKGCFLTADEERSYMPLIEGISYFPSLTFTKTGKLQEISLGYSKDGKVSQEQCLDIYSRSIDWIVREHGELSSPNYGDTHDSPDWLHKFEETPGKQRYRIGIDPDKGSYVTETLWSHRPINLSGQLKEQIKLWKKVPHITLHSVFLKVDETPHCFVSINFYDAKSENDYVD